MPQSQWQIIELLKLNAVEMTPITQNEILEVEIYTIATYQTGKNPYEGHYGHYNTTVTKNIEKMEFRAGDYKISTNQLGVKYLLETLLSFRILVHISKKRYLEPHLFCYIFCSSVLVLDLYMHH